MRGTACRQGDTRAPFSGVSTRLNADLGPARPPPHYNYYFRAVPPWLGCLTTVEELMVARVVPVMRIYRLSSGESDGTCTSLSNELPRHDNELVLVVMRGRGEGTSQLPSGCSCCHPHVQRALVGLCCGEPLCGMRGRLPTCAAATSTALRCCTPPRLHAQSTPAPASATARGLGINSNVICFVQAPTPTTAT